MKKFLVLALLILVGQEVVQAQKVTKIWVVRHAEKDLSDPKDRDPELSNDGKQRAEELKKALKGEKIDSIYTTTYKRTRMTAFPLADKIGINMKSYNPSAQKEFAKQLLANAEGKKLLIVGHSNTILEMVEALGAERPIKEVTEDIYDNLFLVTVKGNKASVKMAKYGASSLPKQ
jgi:2,3-bisphosphoglycerate-dependent phosphoglycerate mutase